MFVYLYGICGVFVYYLWSICMVFVAVFSSGRGHWAPPQVIGHDGHRYQLRLSDIGMLTTCP